MDARTGDLHELATPRKVGGHVVLEGFVLLHFFVLVLSCI